MGKDVLVHSAWVRTSNTSRRDRPDLTRVLSSYEARTPVFHSVSSQENFPMGVELSDEARNDAKESFDLCPLVGTSRRGENRSRPLRE